MIMGAASRVLGIFLGPLGYGLLLVTAAALGHSWWEAKKAGLRGEGADMCTAAYEAKITAAARARAEAQTRVAEELLESERQTTGALRDELDQIKADYQALRVAAAANNNARCLSDGVRRRLGISEDGKLEELDKPNERGNSGDGGNVTDPTG